MGLQVYGLLLSLRPPVRIRAGTPKSPANKHFRGFFFCPEVVLIHDDACLYLPLAFKNLLIGVRSVSVAWHQFWIILLILD